MKLHQSLRMQDELTEFEGDFENLTIIEAMNQLLDPYPKVKQVCLRKGDRLPGLLYFSNKTELSSLGLLKEPLSEDLIIRIVPILHGG